MSQNEIKITASTSTTGNGTHEAFFTIVKELGQGISWTLTQEGNMGRIAAGTYPDERTALNAAHRAAIAWLAQHPESVDA